MMRNSEMCYWLILTLEFQSLFILFEYGGGIDLIACLHVSAINVKVYLIGSNRHQLGCQVEFRIIKDYHKITKLPNYYELEHSIVYKRTLE